MFKKLALAAFIMIFISPLTYSMYQEEQATSSGKINGRAVRPLCVPFSTKPLHFYEYQNTGTVQPSYSTLHETFLQFSESQAQYVYENLLGQLAREKKADSLVIMFTKKDGLEIHSTESWGILIHPRGEGAIRKDRQLVLGAFLRAFDAEGLDPIIYPGDLLARGFTNKQEGKDLLEVYTASQAEDILSQKRGRMPQILTIAQPIDEDVEGFAKLVCVLPGVESFYVTFNIKHEGEVVATFRDIVQSLKSLYAKAIERGADTAILGQGTFAAHGITQKGEEKNNLARKLAECITHKFKCFLSSTLELLLE